MISVIVPVYNVERYLEECLQSILRQTLSDYELILVDDGSTDGSPDICDRYASSHSYIKVIHQPNAGVSAARNAGLAAAKGEYIAFIDSDDWVAPDYLHALAKRAQESGADLVMSGLTLWHSEHNYTTETLSDIRFLDFSKETDLFSAVTQRFFNPSWAKLFKADIIRDHQLKFDTSLWFAEDRDFNIRYIIHAESATTLDYAGYFYRQDLINSLSVTMHGHSYKTELDFWDKLHYIFNHRGYSSRQTRHFLSHKLFYLISDTAAEIASNNALRESISKIETLFENVNGWTYLRQNSKMFSADPLIKFLILRRAPLAIAIRLKLSHAHF